MTMSATPDPDAAPGLDAAASARAGSSVSVRATVNADGHTVCHLDCNGQRVKIIFTGHDVIMDVPDPPKEST